MKTIASALMAGVLMSAAWQTAIADVTASTPAEPAASDSRHEVELSALLDSVSRQSGKRFLVDRHAPARVTIGTLDPDQITYPLLLTVLRDNELAAATVRKDVVNIVSFNQMRTMPQPVLDRDDPQIADEEWVTRVVAVKHASASQLVAVLRPLMQQSGHMAALPDQGKLLMTDTCGNVRRLTAIIEQLDTGPVVVGAK